MRCKHVWVTKDDPHIFFEVEKVLEEIRYSYGDFTALIFCLGCGCSVQAALEGA